MGVAAILPHLAGLRVGRVERFPDELWWLVGSSVYSPP